MTPFTGDLPLLTGATLLEVRDLRVRYPVGRGLWGTLRRAPRRWIRAVDGVSLSVAKGEMLALVGESGCGKTTTGKAILRLVHAYAGTVVLNGRDIGKMKIRALRGIRRSMQMIYQDPYESLDPRFRVSATVAEPLLIHHIGSSRAERSQRVLDALKQAELNPPELYLHRYPHELSGGQRQRVAIAASLAVQPELMVADEPVSMLDVSVRAGVLALLERLRKEGLGILMITHDISSAVRFADRIAVMYLGRIVEEGPAREVVHNPQHPYTQALLSVVPHSDPMHREPMKILKGEAPNPADIPSGCRFRMRCPVARAECATTDPALHVARGAHDPNHRAACILV
jgi:oligopeptide/dipeptide ABC transporter ATP-binding protein